MIINCRGDSEAQRKDLLFPPSRPGFDSRRRQWMAKIKLNEIEPKEINPACKVVTQLTYEDSSLDLGVFMYQPIRVLLSWEFKNLSAL